MGDFGTTLRKLRQAKGISLRKFAEMIGLSPTYISRVELSHDTPPSHTVIEKMEKILECEKDKLSNVAAKDQPNKVPKGVVDAYTKNPVYRKKIPEFLRVATEANLSTEEWNRLIEKMRGHKR